MLRRITWRLWAVVLLGIGAWIGSYFLFGVSSPDAAIYEWGLLLQLVSILMFIVIYTIVTRGQWRKNDIGVNLVLSQLAILPEAGVLCWVFFFRHGHLTSPAAAWIEIWAPWWATVALLSRDFIYLRVRRGAAGLPARVDVDEDTS
jgi:Flp pilus assembly pilin Flp